MFNAVKTRAFANTPAIREPLPEQQWQYDRSLIAIDQDLLIKQS